ncbi:5-methyltetrahydropteroyltriglutamate--homocysteine S-methyltransferase [Domibacillus mangrovi]|uniref:5-methyltetrahydropteroyltriglutamate--homocysteine methyltransferase n=1 Tax=Domibacillus mangrovi TaxID=1714354 RepID=A0A1Q5P1Q2_9BACI|nr:5-methyltetrahydropteroyltriglutamate--homocysteine S-methyltransferase [Domibacillus mangrovi]OKL36062.1 5-methyltetrahydropteroyltriglutamate--homocysteine S-methyltransferase [Domibacillus mangrovi]
MNSYLTSISGYPRIGEKREWKRSIEKYWSGETKQTDFLQEMKELRLGYLRTQKEKGIDMIPVGDFSLYDHILDTAAMFGLVPERFEYDGGSVSLDLYFQMARGSKQAVAMEMTKWFNTNYHYIVPELNKCTPSLVHNRPLDLFLEAKNEAGITGKPVVISPFTFVKLGKGYMPEEFGSTVYALLPHYETVIRELSEAGADWIQIDDPSLQFTLTEEEKEIVTHVYEALSKAKGTSRLLIQTYFDSIDDYTFVTSLPVDGFGLDFVHDRGENASSIEENGFPEEKVLFAGVINGRNIWRADVREKWELLKSMTTYTSEDRLIIQPSCSLLHVPVTTESETKMPEFLKEGLAFANEKLDELQLLQSALREKELLDYVAPVIPGRDRVHVQKEVKQAELDAGDRSRPFAERQVLQREKFQLPLLPTTTIGSFPQTTEVRKKRQQWRKNELSATDYASFIEQETKKWIDIQEKLDLDVLVHGEFERTDMVEFFGEKLKGFYFTQFAWVQSYGSRCVKPPVIYGDVEFIHEMTVKETVYAQSLTSRPVKGMLTGPVTIFNWSFVREDVPKATVMNQIALALRKEVKALEKQGIYMIQVDEPAIREGLPLKKRNEQEYLNYAVKAFKLSVSTVEPDTQIHTHMCYSDFEKIIDSISAMGADVISIETSRSHGELISAFESYHYDKEIGLGVYDIHSPRVPMKEEIIQNIHRALRVLDPKQFWVNPDCGLKTRKEEETVAALQVMVEAAKEVREQIKVTV